MKNELTLRGMVIGLTGSMVITASSMYVALKLGALPWPTIFVAIISMLVLKAFRNTNVREINVTHTAMSAGAMVAGGLAFTMPALWILNPEAEFQFARILILVLGGTLLGLLASGLLRTYFIEIRETTYKYPIGQAAWETVNAGNVGGKQAIELFVTMGLAALVTIFRDTLGKTPPLLTSKFLQARNISLSFWVSPMAVGIGYIIGPLYTGIWFLGALIGFGLIVPLGLSLELFPDAAAANSFRVSAGLGLMVGTGLGVLTRGIFSNFRELLSGAMGTNSILSKKTPFILLLLVIVALPAGGGFLDMGWLAIPGILLVIVGTFIACLLASALTGQTGINPIETLASLVLLAVKILSPDKGTILIASAVVTAVAVGLSGDIMNDFKAGHRFGTSVKAQRIAETAGSLFGALISVSMLYLIVRTYGTESFGNPDIFPAPQAKAVAVLAGGIDYMLAFWICAAIGAIIFISGLPSMTLGLGMYLPTFITMPVALGGAIAFIHRKASGKPQSQTGTLIASGALGGEAVMGVILAIMAMARL